MTNFNIVACYEVSGRKFNIVHNGNRQYTRHFVVEVDVEDPNEDVLISKLIAGNYDFPTLFDSVSETDIGAICTGYTIEQPDSHPYIRIIDVQFSCNLTGEQNEEPEDRDKPPEERRSIVSYEATTVQTAVTEDLSDPVKPLINSSDEPYRGVMVDVPCLVIRIEQYVLTARPAMYIAYFNAVNSSAWQGYPAEKLKVTEARGTPEFFENKRLYKESWAIMFNPLGWKRRLLDIGMRTKTVDGSTRKYQDIRDNVNGTRLSSPVLLDGNGQKLAADADPEYNEFWFSHRVNFNNLGIPR
jgi:hypothetical protein